jgi:transposase-like protein
VPAAFGLSASTVSRRYLQASRHHLQALCERRLEGYDLVAIFLDGKTFASEEMVIALGVMLGGEKVILGFVQTATENERVCRGFLRELLERGLSVAQGVLCVIDGAKGLRAAVRKVFGEHARVRRKLQRAYEQSTYAQAKATLGRLRQELSARNESAVRSLDEGLEETLTLHRLGLCEELGDSFKTTNCLESVNAQVAQLTGRVDRWSNSHQMHRWLAMALLDVEPRLRRVRGYRHLSRLRAALQADLHLCHRAQEELLQAAA